MCGEVLEAMEDKVVFFVKGDFAGAVEAQGTAGADAIDAAGEGVDVGFLRGLAFEADEKRLVGAVAFAGEGEGAVEVDFDAGGLVEDAGFAEAIEEAAGGAHRADGVRAARADANGEDFENANGAHGVRI
jgi:hypothetical protein